MLRMVIMRKFSLFLTIILILSLLPGCSSQEENAQIATSTLPVYEFTSTLCQGTDLTVGRLVTESVSCLHDYTLQVSQMRQIEQADMVVISGLGLEDFLSDALEGKENIVDASLGIEPICPEEDQGHEGHDHHGHSHETDPHIWLSPENAKIMAENICRELSLCYPQHAVVFSENLEMLLEKLDALQNYGEETLSVLNTRQIITFHDGFAYFAQSFDLEILEAIEEESGREASAAELIELIGMVNAHQPGVFTEVNGSASSAQIIARETGCSLYQLDMVMAGDSYFDAMYENIRTVKEALE